MVRRPQEWLRTEWREEAGDVAVVPGTPLELSSFERAPELAGTTTIIHAAGIVKHSRSGPEEMNALNVGGTLNMVRAAAKLKARLIFISTSGTVGCFRFPDVRADEQAPYVEETSGRWPYYASKIRAEKEARKLADKFGVELVIARPPVLLGPGDHRLRSTKHVTRVLDRAIPFIPRGGMHFTDVRDFSAAMVQIVKIDAPKPTYHFPGHESSLKDFFAMVSEVSGVPVTSRQAPTWLLKGISKVSALAPKLPDPVYLEMAMCHWGLSSLWSEKDLGYTPRAPRQTLSDTVRWVREHRAGGSVSLTG